MKLLSSLGLLLPLTLLFSQTLARLHPRQSPQIPRSITIPNTTTTAPSTAIYSSTPYTPLDGPKVHPINATTWDWWYFDAVELPHPSTEDRASILVVFYTAVPSGVDTLGVYADLGFKSALLVEIVATWPNGTISGYVINAEEARVETFEGGEGDGAKGEWVLNDSTVSFEGTADLRRYSVGIDAGAVTGSVELISIAPPHYPCGPNEPNQTMEIAPGIGWANAMPDAIADVKLDIEGEKFYFTGTGYHDKNWSDRPLAPNIGVWYWGHARLGPYSIVWFDYLSPAPALESHVSAYVSLGNEILVAQCSGISVRPYGENSTYPPTENSGAPSGYDVKIDMPDETVLEVRVAADVSLIAFQGELNFGKWIGGAWGAVGGVNLTGSAMMEEFVYLE